MCSFWNLRCRVRACPWGGADGSQQRMENLALARPRVGRGSAPCPRAPVRELADLVQVRVPVLVRPRLVHRVWKQNTLPSHRHRRQPGSFRGSERGRAARTGSCQLRQNASSRRAEGRLGFRREKERTVDEGAFHDEDLRPQRVGGRGVRREARRRVAREGHLGALDHVGHLPADTRARGHAAAAACGGGGSSAGVLLCKAGRGAGRCGRGSGARLDPLVPQRFDLRALRPAAAPRRQPRQENDAAYLPPHFTHSHKSEERE